MTDWAKEPGCEGLRDAELAAELARENIPNTKNTPASTETPKGREVGKNLTAHGGGLRRDEGKLRYDLLPPYPLRLLAEVYTKGAAIYEPRNWEKGIAFDNCIAALMRHLEKYRAGSRRDKDGQHHLASVAFWCFAMMEYERTGVVPLPEWLVAPPPKPLEEEWR